MPTEQARTARKRRRFRRDGIIFAIGCAGMVTELAGAFAGYGPHAALVGAFLVCMLAPAGLRYGDRTMDALRWINEVTEQEEQADEE